MRDILRNYEQRVINGDLLGYHDGVRLTSIDPDSPEWLDLIAVANRVRLHFKGTKIDTCAIVNAKSGSCSEDCSFCSQSAHNGSEVPAYALMDGEAISKAADAAFASGAEAFGLVAAWKGLKEGPELDTLLTRISELAQNNPGHVDGSLGHVPTVEIAHKLKAAGLTTYGHNLETAPSHFEKICTTHTFQDRVDSILRLKEAGIQICSGGIFGMGESWEQRVELAMHLRDLDTSMLPMNFLNPIPGTPLGHLEPMAPKDCLKTIAIYRMLLPTANLMLAGGREVSLRDMQSWAFHAGASACMIGNYLTTPGRGATDDHRMIADLGLTSGAGHCATAVESDASPLKVIANSA